jgi:hypothetical protein
MILSYGYQISFGDHKMEPLRGNKRSETLSMSEANWAKPNAVGIFAKRIS